MGGLELLCGAGAGWLGAAACLSVWRTARDGADRHGLLVGGATVLLLASQRVDMAGGGCLAVTGQMALAPHCRRLSFESPPGDR